MPPTLVPQGGSAAAGARQEPTRSPPGAYQDPTRSLPGAYQEPTRSLPGAHQEPAGSLPGPPRLARPKLARPQLPSLTRHHPPLSHTIIHHHTAASVPHPSLIHSSSSHQRAPLVAQSWAHKRLPKTGWVSPSEQFADSVSRGHRSIRSSVSFLLHAVVSLSAREWLRRLLWLRWWQVGRGGGAFPGLGCWVGLARSGEARLADGSRRGRRRVGRGRLVQGTFAST